MQFELQSLVRDLQNSNFVDTFSLGFEDFSVPTNTEILNGAFAIDWRKAQAFLESRFPKAYQLMRTVGVHSESGQSVFLDPTTELEFEDNFSNVGQHLSCVGVIGYALAQFGVEHGLITKDQVHTVVEAALMHDIVKPYQVALLRALHAGRIANEDFLSPDPYYEKATQYLIRRGIEPREAASLFTDYGNETGGEPDVLRIFLDTDSSGLRPRLLGTPAQHLIHLADDMAASLKPISGESPRNFLLTARERILLTQNRSREWIGWQAGFGVGVDGALVELPNVYLPPSDVRPLGSLHGLMTWVSDLLICNSLVRAAGIESRPAEAAWRIKAEIKMRLPYSFV